MKLNLEVKINSGAAAILYAIGFFGTLLFTKYSSFVGQNIIGILGAWTVGFGGYLVKRGHDNRGQNELELGKLGCLNGGAK